MSCVVAYSLTGAAFLQRCLRLKWLFLSIFLICAYSTPGEYILAFKAFADVTREGVQLGFMQVSKVVMAIACLTIVFYKTGAAQFMTGLYYLLLPLTVLGLNVERFVVRLSLTLQYVDSLTGGYSKSLNFINLFRMVQSDDANIPTQSILLQKASFSLLDIMVTASMLIGLLLLLVKQLEFLL